jgi:hypothetical protein
VAELQERFGFSQRRACRVVGGVRSTIHCRRQQREGDEVGRRRLRQLAGQRPRFGYRRLQMLLRREALALEVNTSLPGSRVVRVLDRLAGDRERPGQLVLDNGPELDSRVLEQWAYQHAVTCTSSTRASRSRTPTARASTGGCATSAATSTGS